VAAGNDTPAGSHAQADYRTCHFHNSSGILATLAAIRRASSRGAFD
jgi:hypothetical protein